MQENVPTVIHKYFSKQLFFVIFTRNFCFGVFLNKAAGLKTCIFIEKEIPTQVPTCEFSEIFKAASSLNPFYYTLTKFYVMIDIRYIRVTNVKLGHLTERTL